MTSNQVITENAKKILEFLNESDELDGNGVIKAVETAFVNQIVGTIVGKSPTGDEEIDTQRHYQLVTIFSDMVVCMKKRFMSDSQVKAICEGVVLQDIELMSERLLALDADQCFLGAGPDSTN